MLVYFLFLKKKKHFYLHFFFVAFIPGQLSFYFLSFFQGILFLRYDPLFWFRNTLFFFSVDPLCVAGRAQVDLTLSSVKSCSASWGLGLPGPAP